MTSFFFFDDKQQRTCSVAKKSKKFEKKLKEKSVPVGNCTAYEKALLLFCLKTAL